MRRILQSTVKTCSKICNALAALLSGSLNLLFGNVLVKFVQSKYFRLTLLYVRMLHFLSFRLAYNLLIRLSVI